MGTASRGSSGAAAGGYSDAKQQLADAVSDGDAGESAEIYFKVILAAQPNGAAKLPAYVAMSHSAKFLIHSQQHGVESATKETAKNVVKSQVAGEVAEGVVDSASKEVANRGMEDADRAFSDTSERAAETASGSVMTQGADAIEKRRSSK